MKTAVVYFSETGNTAKVAAAIAEGVTAASAAADGVACGAAGEGASVVAGDGRDAARVEDVLVGPLDEAPDLDGCDLVFVGMPIVKFGPPEPVRQFIAARCAGRDVALFVTHAAPVDLEQAQPWLQACRDAATGARLTGFFHCQGQLAEPVRQWMLASDMPMLAQFAEMASCADGQPDEASLARAAAFAREMCESAGRRLAGVAK